MKTEYRNQYITENFQNIASIVYRHAEKRGLDFNEVLQIISEKLILYLDTHDKPPEYLTQWIGNNVNKIKPENNEWLCWSFEELIFPDFSKPFVISEWFESAHLTHEEKDVFAKHAFEGYSLREIARLYNKNVMRISRIFNDACAKLRISYILWS